MFQIEGCRLQVLRTIASHVWVSLSRFFKLPESEGPVHVGESCGHQTPNMPHLGSFAGFLTTSRKVGEVLALSKA